LFYLDTVCNMSEVETLHVAEASILLDEGNDRPSAGVMCNNDSHIIMNPSQYYTYNLHSPTHYF